MFLFLLQGCTPDKWTPTREVCGLAEPLDWGLLSTGDSGERHGLIPPSGCAEALLEDLGAKPQRLLDDIGASGTLDDHIEDVRTGVAPLDGLASVVWGMYWLVGGDFGTVGGLVALQVVENPVGQVRCGYGFTHQYLLGDPVYSLCPRLGNPSMAMNWPMPM